MKNIENKQADEALRESKIGETDFKDGKGMQAAQLAADTVDTGTEAGAAADTAATGINKGTDEVVCAGKSSAKTAGTAEDGADSAYAKDGAEVDPAHIFGEIPDGAKADPANTRGEIPEGTVTGFADICDGQTSAVTDAEDTEEGQILYEDISLRGTDSRHFRMGDGTYRAVYYNEPVNFFDEKEGVFKEIDNEFEPSPAEDGGGFDGYRNKRGALKVKLAGKIKKIGTLMELEKSGYKLEFRLLGRGRKAVGNKAQSDFGGVNAAKALIAKNDGNKAENNSKKVHNGKKGLDAACAAGVINYDGFTPGADLQYIVSGGKVKENIIVRERAGCYDYAFVIKADGLDIKTNEDGTVEFLAKNGERIFTIPAGHMTDADGAFSPEVKYGIKALKKGGYLFSVIPDAGWINAADRIFPVTIDPTVYTYSTSVIDSVTCCSNTNLLYQQHFRFVGGGTYPEYTYFKFNLPLDTAKYRILKAGLILDFYTCGKDMGIEVRSVNSGSWSPSAISWQTKPGYSDAPEGYYNFNVGDKLTKNIDLTKILHKDASALSKGILLKPKDESNSGYIEFNSEYSSFGAKPCLVLTYADSSIVSDKQQRNSVNRAGTGILDLHTQNLKFVHEDLVLEGSKMPLGIYHVYNSRMGGMSEIKPQIAYAASGDMCMGAGWKTNYNQYMFPVTAVNNLDGNSPAPKYVYTDSMGDEHIFTGATVDGVYKITDASGRLTYNEATRIISDADGNMLCFDALYRLVKIENNSGIKTYINYSQNKISSVKDGSGREAYFNYVSTLTGGNILDSIQYGGKETKFEYNPDYRIAAIVYPDGDRSTFGYSQSKLSSIRDRAGYGLKYLYGSNKITISENTNVGNIADNSVTSCAEKSGKAVVVEYGEERTYISDGRGRRLVHIFDRAGKAYCSYVEEGAGGNTINTVGGIQFGYQEFDAEKNTSAATAVTAQGDAVNYVVNGGFNNGLTGWTIINPLGNTVSSAASVDGDGKCFSMTGMHRINMAAQTITNIPEDISSFILSGFAKADSLPLNEITRFNLCGKIYYSDGTSEEAKRVDFNCLDKEWQFAAVGLWKSTANRYKTISSIQVVFEYCYNYGSAYFDNIRLVCGTGARQTATYNNTTKGSDIIIEDTAGIVTNLKTDKDGRVIKSEITNKSDSNIQTDYTYQQGSLKTQYDTFSGMKKENFYRSADFTRNFLYESRINNTGDSGTGTMYATYDTFINTGGEEQFREYDARGTHYYTSAYDNVSGLLKYVKNLEGKAVNYAYNSDNSLKSISAADENITHSFNYTKGLLTRLTVQNGTDPVSEYMFEYDGFGVLTKTLLNGYPYTVANYNNTCVYGALTNENEFDYSQIWYCNGIDAGGKNRDYALKTIYDKNGNILCENGTRFDEGYPITEEVLRAQYGAHDKLSRITDKSMGADKTVTYDYSYNPDGSIDEIKFNGYREGRFKYKADRNGLLSNKNLRFAGPNKSYSYFYTSYHNGIAPDNLPERITTPAGDIGYVYDKLGRLSYRNKKDGSIFKPTIFREDYTYLKTGDRTTPYISNVAYTGASFSANAAYTYDTNGNIATVTDVGGIKYGYDGLGRLLREDNAALSFSRKYTYDKSGNITQVAECPYTTGTLGGPNFIWTYTYTDGRLTKAEKKGAMQTINPITYIVEKYDIIGNPCKWRSNVLKWERGRLLTGYGAASYVYDINGIRQEKKTASGVTHNYYTEGNIIHKETRDGNELWYYYDATGITGMEYNGAVYFFLKNIQGDVTRIVDATGKLVARYIYDAWGCHKVYNASGVVTTDTAHIGNINPFRYRGYYYDAETGLYYLNSRYYDPEAGRFINADDISYLAPEEINGCNLYAYCLNNPVMMSDSTGHVPEWLKDVGRFLGGLVIIVVGAVATIATLPLFLIPGASSVPLFTLNMTTYGAMLMATPFSSTIKSDMVAICWNPFNSNEAAVLASQNISFYKGTFVVRYGDAATTRGGGFSFGIIGIGRGETRLGTVSHEYGHHKQQRLMGLLLYTPIVAIPSLVSATRENPNHSDLWFERWATNWGNGGWIWW